LTPRPSVLVSIVTWNSAEWLEVCLASLWSQTFQPLRVAVWDNDSTDETVDILTSHSGRIDSLHVSSRNVGFCTAHNRTITENPADYVLVLNPDVKLAPQFVETLVEALECDREAGSATGRLWRWNGEATPEAQTGSRVLDTTGIYFTPSQRHFDRGSGEEDRGQYDRREYVFGTSGCAAFYRRTMLELVKADGEYFDEDFFAYREDADLAWRLQWMGLRCLYVPEATGWHVRRVLPERRASLPAAINMHSVKNRFLMRVKNMDLGTYARFFVPITARDLGAFVYMALRERSSFAAVPLFIRALPRALAVRRALRRHRRVAPRELRRWFASRPAAPPSGRS
jgi:GT2 family glycosyltransferase